MSALTDLFHGNFGNIGHDLTAHLGKDLVTGGEIAAAIAAATVGLPMLGSALGIGAGGLEGLGLSGLGGAGLTGFDALAAGLTPSGGAAALGTLPAEAGIVGAAGAAPLSIGASAPLGGGAGSAAALTPFGSLPIVPDAGTVAIPGLEGVGTAAAAPPAFGSLPVAAESGVAPIQAAVDTGGASSGGLFGGINSMFTQHPILTSLGIGAAGQLAAPALRGLINPVPQQGALQGLAGQEAALAKQQGQYGQQLQQPLLTGQLPADAAQKVDNAFNDAVNTVKARYASLGLSGSTMESDAIANLTKQKTALTFDIAQQMATTGAQAISSASSAFGLQDQVYQSLMQAQVQQDAALQSAIASMASAAALGGAIQNRAA